MTQGLIPQFFACCFLFALSGRTAGRELDQCEFADSDYRVDKLPADEETIDWDGEVSDWHGYSKYSFEVDGRSCFVVAPQAQADDAPWVWRARFPNYHPEADLLLLQRGFHVAYVNTDGMLGSPRAMAHWDQFYQAMISRGLSRRVALEGVSRGGLFVYGFAARWPERVACIYADTPVCDFKSWPGGTGVGRGHAGVWQTLLE